MDFKEFITAAKSQKPGRRAPFIAQFSKFLCSLDGDQAELVCRYGACEWVTSVLEESCERGNKEEALSSCDALGHLATKGQLLDRRRACAACVKMIDRFPCDKEVVRYWGPTVRLLAHMDRENALSLAQLGVYSCVVRTLENFLHDKQVVRDVFMTVVFVYSSDEDFPPFNHGELCRLILNGIRKHPKDSRLVYDGCNAIFHVACDDEEVCEMLAEEGGCELATSLLVTDNTDPRIAEAGCNLVNYFNDSPSCRVRLTGSTQLIVGKLNLFKEDDRAVYAAFGALTYLPEAELVHSGACEAVVQAFLLNRSPSERIVEKWTLVLSEWSRVPGLLSKLVSLPETCELVVSCLSHPSREVAEQAIDTLFNFTSFSSARVRRRLLLSNVCERVAGNLHHFLTAEDDVTLSRGCVIIMDLLRPSCKRFGLETATRTVLATRQLLALLSLSCKLRTSHGCALARLPQELIKNSLAEMLF